MSVIMPEESALSPSPPLPLPLIFSVSVQTLPSLSGDSAPEPRDREGE